MENLNGLSIILGFIAGVLCILMSAIFAEVLGLWLDDKGQDEHINPDTWGNL